MSVTVWNCKLRSTGGCPRLWELMAPGEDAAVRDCGRCERPVYLCATDAEVAARLRAGHLVAWAEPTDADLGTQYSEIAGMPYPLAWGPGTPEQQDARRLRARGRAIDGAIWNARHASRDCPGCGCPLPNHRVACRVCGAEVGRLYDADGNILWPDAPK